jgi:LPXTG-site transpeptidase (sortase) family protein
MPARARARMMRAMERILIVIAVAATSYYATMQVYAAREQTALSRELEAARAAVPDAVTTSPPVVRPSTATRPPLPARAIVAKIEVPRLRMSAIAREGVDVRTLRGSVGHVPGTALPGEPGNAAFAAHRDTFFRPLEGIRSGDVIVVTTADGVHRYTVVGTRVVEPTEVSVLRSTDRSQLTLVTCYPFAYVGSAPQRFIVQAVLVRS